MALRGEEFGRFFLPGPSEVRTPVLQAQARAMIGHRGAEVRGLMEELQQGLREVFRTRRPVFVSTSSASGLMEAGIRNGVRGRVLCLVNGAFSERFPAIARACELEVEVLEVAWGHHHDPGLVRRKLQREEVDAVTVVHSETSTGALNPVEEIAQVVREFEDVVVVVDSVTGVGGARLLTDEWMLDFVLTGSQKALALPPGLSFAVASERMMQRSAECRRKGLYFDLLELAKYLERGETPTTPALSLMFALQEQLGFIGSEGMERRWARHSAMAEQCWEWVREMREERGVPLRVLAPEGHRSPTVTCISLPEGRSGPEVAGLMRERGFVIGSGYGRLKAGTIRVGHMGDHSVDELDELLQALSEVLAR